MHALNAYFLTAIQAPQWIFKPSFHASTFQNVALKKAVASTVGGAHITIAH